MRQVKFAQRFASVVAVVRNAAFVAVADVVRSLSLLHTHITGTTSKSIWGKPDEIYYECQDGNTEWYRGYGMNLRPAMQPVPCPVPSSNRPS